MYRIPKEYKIGQTNAFVQTYLVARNEVLLLKRPKTDKFFPDELIGIGGHIELLESAEQAALREIHEELGFKYCTHVDLRGVYFWLENSERKTDCGGINYIFTGSVAKQELFDLKDKTIGTLKWCKIAELSKQPLAPHLKFFLIKILKDKNYFYTGSAIYTNDSLTWYGKPLG
jgi:8-oxo-dGTP pyrophosphatase MutT (NUDIX family)